ncbi:MAG: glycosyltransferase family 2 protein, partial [Lachnospiraceae bacterium]|nr:glycosyltransferase family 2 protein [Lachnospiraceae bacterium]
MAKTTVVIPNWNGMAYLKNCMDSLEKQDDRDFETLVIDNASKDGSVAFLRENYPWARVEVMPENLGFAGGVNEGIRRTKTPYVLLLNNDVEVEPHFVKALTDAIDRDPKVFSVSSKMIKFRERHLLDDAGDRYTVIGWQAQRGTALPVTRKHYNRPAAVFSACAGAAIYRLSVLQEIGAFDPAHFAYLEDIDLGWRARIYGYKNMYEPSAVVYHVGSASSGAVTYSDFKVRISARNSQYIVYKNMPAFQRFLCAFPMWIGRKVKKR